MNETERDRKVYQLAFEFLSTGFVDQGVTVDVIKRYQKCPPRPDSIPVIYERMIGSIQNADRKKNAIGKTIGGVDKLKPVLYDFDPVKIKDNFKSTKEVLERIVEQFPEKLKKINKTPKGLWPLFCKGILSAAEFLSQFSSADGFYKWADPLYNNDLKRNGYFRPLLPMSLMSPRISGFGFPLACDFLKGLGYTEYPKPDRHLQDVFKALGLCTQEADQVKVFWAIKRVAENSGVTPYAADKLFWLICSGEFHDDTGKDGKKAIGIKGKIRRQKENFIFFAKQQLALNTNV